MLLEDEKSVGSTLLEWLSREGFDLTWSSTLADARLQIRSRKFDLAILDIGLPDGSGFDLAKEIRETPALAKMAIIFLTAFGGPADRMKGLSIGAEDYVAKPFHLKELLLRIQVSLKKHMPQNEESEPMPKVMQLGKAIIRLAAQEAEVDGKLFSLTPKECLLLKFLNKKRGTPVSVSEIQNEVWQGEPAPPAKTIDYLIIRLRRLIETQPDQPTILVNVGEGNYQLSI